MKGSPKTKAARRPYRTLSHTADLGLRVRGADLQELYENAAKALVATMTDRRRLRHREDKEITVEASDPEALLVTWLNHLLYLYDVDGFLGRDFHIVELSPERLTAVARGEQFDPGRHPSKTAVKAATYHRLAINRTTDGWRATVILDL
ncbi:MAG: archease [Deltaproteobacteria bacterium]|nr:archease [Deltaproteobacteria bacterium]